MPIAAVALMLSATGLLIRRATRPRVVVLQLLPKPSPVAEP